MRQRSGTRKNGETPRRSKEKLRADIDLGRAARIVAKQVSDGESELTVLTQQSLEIQGMELRQIPSQSGVPAKLRIHRTPQSSDLTQSGRGEYRSPL